MCNIIMEMDGSKTFESTLTDLIELGHPASKSSRDYAMMLNVSPPGSRRQLNMHERDNNERDK